MSKLSRVTWKGPKQTDERTYGYAFHCPGCDGLHMFVTDPEAKVHWEFDGNLEKPTFKPSLVLLPHPDQPRCHLVLTVGVLHYCTDSEHELAGKKVPLPDIPD